MQNVLEIAHIRSFGTLLASLHSFIHLPAIEPMKDNRTMFIELQTQINFPGSSTPQFFEEVGSSSSRKKEKTHNILLRRSYDSMTFCAMVLRFF